MGYLKQLIDRWRHFSATDRLRLHGFLEDLQLHPANLQDQMPSLAKLGRSGLEKLLTHMTALSLADGHLVSQEREVLGRLAQDLGLDQSLIWHEVQTEFAASKEVPLAIVGFHLDEGKVESLRQESEELGLLLANIFESTEAPVVQKMKLGPSYKHFAQQLMSQREWSREDLVHLATRLGIMLDGALEMINEAALDQWGLPFCEGEDPIAVNEEILERVEL